MPPATVKQYDEVVVTALLVALKSKGGSLNEAIKDMVALDGNRTHSSFEHSLRAANKLAGDLNTKKLNGVALEPSDIPGTAPASAIGATASPKTPKKRSKFFEMSQILYYYRR
jgi:hypothetical protein